MTRGEAKQSGSRSVADKRTKGKQAKGSEGKKHRPPVEPSSSSDSESQGDGRSAKGSHEGVEQEPWVEQPRLAAGGSWNPQVQEALGAERKYFTVSDSSATENTLLSNSAFDTCSTFRDDEGNESQER